MGFKEYYKALLKEKYKGTEEDLAKYEELLEKLKPLASEAKKEEKATKSQYVIFRENSGALLFGVRDDSKKYIERAKEIVAKYPQFKTTTETIHWTTCLVIEGPGIYLGYNDLHTT